MKIIQIQEFQEDKEVIMPIPIKPVHSLDLHAEIFDGPSMEGLGLSSIQIQMLGLAPTVKEASVKLGDKYLELLKTIDQNIDEVVTAANSIMNLKDGKVCSVPTHISDNDLLALKTAGLLSGYGRSVELTERAKLTLRDHYLSTETSNEFRKARTKEKFDLNQARSVKASNSKFKKVAS
jgi:replication-associated recombination protein RarA